MQTRKILHNTFAFLGGEFFYHFINFLACILIARALGGEGYGQFSFIYVYLSFFEAFVQFGLNAVLTRELSHDEENSPRILGNALLFRAALVVASLPVTVTLVRLLGYPATIQQGIFLASFQLFFTLRPVFEAVFRARLQMIVPAVWNVIRAFVNLGLVAIVARMRPSLPFFILTYLASGSISLVGLAFSSQKRIAIDLRPDRKLLAHLIRESAPLVLSAYLTLLYYRIDVMMLSMMKTFRDVGYYSVAVRLTESLNILSNGLLISLFPLFSKAFAGNRIEFEMLIAKAFRWMLLLGAPLLIGGVLTADDLIHLFFGSEYASSGATLKILLGYTFFCFVGMVLANVLIACRKQMADMWISASLVFLNIGLNWFWIPSFNYNGAAAATVVTEAVGVGIYFWYAMTQPAIRLAFPSREFLTTLKVNIPFAVLLFLIRGWVEMPVLIFILLGMVIYSGLLFFFGELSWKEIRELA